MNRQRLGAWLLSVLVGVAAFPLAAWCCNVPVFRYALENWQPDAFQVLVLSHGPLTEDQQAWVSRLENAADDDERPANLQVHSFDLDQGELDKDALAKALPRRLLERQVPGGALDQFQRWADDQPIDQPVMLVFYPRLWDRLAWRAKLSAEHVEQLIDSPLRQEIANRILGGESAVWVLLESGDAERDEKAWQVLQSELKRSAEVVQLPQRELIESDEYYNPDVEIELKVDFSAVRLSASDDRERAFASLLRGSESDLVDFDEPIAIPIYGRGRTYFALVGAGINDKTIEENGQFLCGACSCQVKTDNPGVDMLFAVDWGGRVQGSAMPDIVLPELTGIGALGIATVSTSSDGGKAERSGTNRGTTTTDDVAASAGSIQAVEPPVPGAADQEVVTGGDAFSANKGATSTASADDPIGGSHESRAVVEEVTTHFERRLLFGIAVGVVVAMSLLCFATFGLRRAV